MYSRSTLFFVRRAIGLEALMQKVQNDLKAKGLKQKELAKELGVSSSMISQYFKSKSNIDFEKFLKMVHFIYNYNYEHLILEFCKVTSSTTNIREALEWSLQRWIPHISEDIYKCELQKKNLVNEIYGLLLKSRSGELSPEEFFKQIQEFRIKADISKLLEDNSDSQVDESAQFFVMFNVCMMYYYTSINAYSLIPGLAELTMVYVKKIKSDFLQKTHMLNIQEMLVVSYLYLDKRHEAEYTLKTMDKEYAYSFLPLMYISILSLESEITLFSNIESSVDKVTEAIRYLESFGFKGYERRKRHLQSLHDFIKITGGKLENLFLTDPEQKLYYMAAKQDYRALDEIKMIEGNRNLSALELYIKGILTSDIIVMRACENKFIDQQNLHLRRLPKQYIDMHLKA